VENVYLALIVAIPAMMSPLLMAWLTNRNRAQEKTEDYARQDAVAAKAELAARKVAEAAELLLASNAQVAKAADEASKATNTKLDVIHTLVNSNMTAAMQAELDSRRIALALMLEVVELKKTAGSSPTAEALEAVGAAKGKIVELEAALNDRLKQSKEIEKIQNDKMVANLKNEK
jgi:hypothetical protein